MRNVLKRITLTFLIILISVVQVPERSMASNHASKPKIEKGIDIYDDKAINPYEQKAIKMVNKIRMNNGLNTLEPNRQLSMVARYKARDMRDRHYFSHYSPTFGSPFSMLKRFGLNYKEAFENISAGQNSPEKVVGVWMNDKETFQAIHNPRFTDIGVGYVPNGKKGPYWVLFMSF